MRELKFRVVVVNDPTFDEPGIYVSYPMTLQEIINGDDVQFTDGGYISLRELNPEYSVWERYTGLTDRNGTEIYEGDILGCRGSEEAGVFSVVWAEKLSGWGKLWYPMSDLDYEDVNEYGPYEIDATDLEAYEVIGNIHENANLLEAI